jgi:hypothetical protein
MPPHNNLRILCFDRLRRQRHSLQSRPANLIDGERANLRRQSSVDRRLPRRILPQPCLQHAPHNALINLSGLNTRTPHRLAHRQRTQFRPRKRLQ